MNYLQKVGQVLLILVIVIAIQIISISLTLSHFLDIRHMLIHPVWVYSKSTMWIIWTVKTALITFCIARVYPYKESKQRSRIFKLWALAFILDMIWPLVFLWLGSSLFSAIIITCMLPVLYLTLFSTFILDKPAGYALIVLCLIILSKVFLHWTIYWLNIKAL